MSPRHGRSPWLLVYRALLRLYPGPVRKRFGPDMAECFDDLRRTTRRDRGRAAELGLVVRTFGELPRSALRAHRERLFGSPGKQPLDPPLLRSHRGSRIAMDTIMQDIRFGLRSFRRSPGFAVLAVLSLALGVGANTTMFSTVNAVLWQDLPAFESHRLVRVFQERGGYSNFSYPNFADLRDQSGDVFDGMFLHRLATFGLSSDEGTQVIHGEVVSASYFQVLGLEPALGRFFTAPESDNASAEPVVVLNHTFWQRNFGGARDIVGRVVRINNEPMTVVGVAPEGFNGTKFGLGMEVWIPAKIWGRVAGWGNWTDQRGSASMDAVARLAEGVAMSQAQEAVTLVAARLAKEYPDVNRDRTFGVFPVSVVVPDAAGLPNLIGLLAIGASALVLLVACANVASLLFARAAARQREVGVRVALGAGRARLVRQFITESVVLAAAGGGVGLALSFWTTGFIKWFLPTIPYRFAIDARPDLVVFGFAAAVSALAAFAFGLLPAIHATNPNLASVIKGDSAGTGTAVDKARMLNGVVVAMVALSFVTLLLSGLFTKSLDGVRHMNPGFATTQRLLATFDTRLAGLTRREGLAFIDELGERVRGLPGVRHAAWASVVPLGDRSNASRVYADDRTYEADDLGVSAWRSTVSPGYFETIGTRLLQGRDFGDQDDADAPRKVIVNEALARRYWPDASAVGERLRYSRTSAGTVLEIVGVVETGRYGSFGEEPRPAMFLPLEQAPANYVNLVVHADLNPTSLIAPVRRVAAAIDPAVPMFDVKTMNDHLTFALWMYKLGAGLGGALGLLALVLASAGLYGVMSFSVGQRTRELGIRVALGANHGRVLFLVLKRGLFLAGIGIGIGAVAALGLSGVLSSVLLGVAPTDPGTFTAVAVGLAVVALLASLIPARSATKTDPVEALRVE